MDVMHIGATVQRNTVVALVAVAGGFVGSVLHDLIKAKSTTVRAERFEVVESSGRLVSYWGPDADPHIPSTTPKGAILVFVDPHGVRRCQIGSRVGDCGPELLFYDSDGPPAKPQQNSAQPRLSIGLGSTGSPTLNMHGHDGDRMDLGAMYGDVDGEPELGWGLSFRAFAVPATAAIGYGGWGNKSYRSFVTLTNGAGKSWEAVAGEELKPLPPMKCPSR
jgi:hypothetical protein